MLPGLDLAGDVEEDPAQAGTVGGEIHLIKGERPYSMVGSEKKPITQGL